MPQIHRSLKKPIKILFEDDSYVVFDKPAGLLVIPSPKKEQNTLVNIVNFQQVSQSDLPTKRRLYPCHRLDRDTSGAIIFAKGKKNQKLMMDEFHRLSVNKKYVAFVHGRIKKQTGTIKSYIKGLDKARYQKRAKPKRALTRYNVIQRKKQFTVTEVSPETGRTNQIRIHLRDLGHPLVGERKYAFARDYPLKFKRTALHAQQLEWKHPLTKKTVKVISPMAEDMKRFLERH